MSKFSNLLQVLLILKSKGRVKSKEIAKVLDTSERMVRKYIVDLAEAGVNVQSIPGPTGGYELIGYDYLVNSNINDEELAAFRIIKSNSLNEKNMEQQYLNSVLNSLENKLALQRNLSKEYKDYSTNMVLPSRVNDLIIQNNIELKIYEAMLFTKKVNIEYTSASSGKSNRIIHPYKIITRGELKYLVCYCEKRDKILTLKLVRFGEVEILEDIFNKPSEVVLKEMIKGNKIGLISGEDIKVKLLIKPPFAQSVSDRIYSSDQTIIKNDDESIIFEATLNGKEDTKRWILSMKNNVKVLEPEEIRSEIIRDIENMLIVYEDCFK